MLKKEYLVAKIGFDTAENEPTKVRGFLIGVGWIIPIAYADGLLRNMLRKGVNRAAIERSSWLRTVHAGGHSSLLARGHSLY